MKGPCAGPCSGLTEEAPSLMRGCGPDRFRIGWVSSNLSVASGEGVRADNDAAVQVHLDAREPPFSLMGIYDLVPVDRRDSVLLPTDDEGGK